MSSARSCRVVSKTSACLWAALLASALAGCGRSGAVEDPIAKVPLRHQRTATRSDFPAEWPFSVGRGTLGCSDGAVLFRALGVTYGLNDAALHRGFRAVAPIRTLEPAAPPTRPLARLTQDARMKIFSEASSCGAGVADQSSAVACRTTLRQEAGVSEAELQQVEAEGRERRWPPLERAPADLGPLVKAGLALCDGSR